MPGQTSNTLDLLRLQMDVTSVDFHKSLLLLLHSIGIHFCEWHEEGFAFSISPIIIVTDR